MWLLERFALPLLFSPFFLPLFFLGGCVSGLTGSTYFDGRFWYTNVKSASDIAGGPRQDILIVVDRDGNIVDRNVAAGPAALQVLETGLTSVISAGGQVAGSALLRPTRNFTSSTINGGSNTTAQSTTTTTSTNSNSGNPNASP